MDITTIAHPNQARLEELIEKMRDQHRLMGQVIDCLDHKLIPDPNDSLPETHREAYAATHSGGLGAMRPALRLAELLAMWEPIAGCQSGPLAIPALLLQDAYETEIIVPEGSYDLFHSEIAPNLTTSDRANREAATDGLTAKLSFSCDETAAELSEQARAELTESRRQDEEEAGWYL